MQPWLWGEGNGLTPEQRENLRPVFYRLTNAILAAILVDEVVDLLNG